MNHQLQREILHRARFMRDGAKYSQLAIDEIENDLFNYHLQQLVKSGLLDKRNSKYWLSSKGKSQVTNIDEVDKSLPQIYKVSVYLCPIVEGRVLLYRRRKEPQYGYTGFISEKIRFGEGVLTAARRGLEEETGLQADFYLVGNLRQVRKDAQGGVLEDGTFYVCVTDKVGGKLREKGEEGEYFWTDIDKVRKIKKLFRPSVELVLGNVIADWRKCFIYDVLPEKEEY